MANNVPDDARDRKTPDDVIIRMSAAPPRPDPTLGVEVRRAAPPSGRPVHRLVTIGDSLTHGFQSGAIHNTHISWPVIVAWELGWDSHLRYPTYQGYGGLPINIEYLVRDLERGFGDKVNWWETAFAGLRLRHVMAEIEQWWERGPGAHVPKTTGIMHNLAVYGWDLRDALERNADNLAKSIAKPRNNVFMQIVENANERAALRVYESARDANGKALSAFQAAALLSADGAEMPDGSRDRSQDGIETLVVALGGNNALGVVTTLKVRWSDAGFDDLEGKKGFTVWRPSHFQAELRRVVAAIQEIRARHVILATVPHVTIAPVARGVATKIAPGSRYYPYYTRPWIDDREFDSRDDPCITSQEARAVDCAIDQYNDAIADAVKTARQAGKSWFLLDFAGMLDRLAARRYFEDVQARPDWWTPYELPAALQALQPVPDSRFFSSGPNGRVRGGLFSLDGVHPTTIAYGLMAQECIDIMTRAGVTFQFGDERTVRQPPIHVDFNRLVRLDSLISDPPRSLDSDMHLLGWLDEAVDVFKRILPFRS